jgi:hypothetical protein
LIRHFIFPIERSGPGRHGSRTGFPRSRGHGTLSGPDLVPLAVRQLALNGVPVPALLVQNRARGGAKTVGAHLIAASHEKRSSLLLARKDSFFQRIHPCPKRLFLLQPGLEPEQDAADRAGGPYFKCLSDTGKRIVAKRSEELDRDVSGLIGCSSPGGEKIACGYPMRIADDTHDVLGRWRQESGLRNLRSRSLPHFMA